MSKRLPSRNKSAVAKHIALAEQLCQQRGQRLTEMRREVLTLLLQRGTAIKAYDLLEALRETHPQIAPTTVYRPLQFLVELGLVHRIDSLNAYIACTHDDPETLDFLLVCPRCAAISEIEDESVSGLLAKHLEQQGFVAQHHSVEISAICKTCATSNAHEHSHAHAH